MDKKHKSKKPPRKVTSAPVLSPGPYDEHSIDMFVGSRDPAFIVKSFRENWESSLQDQRPVSMSRAYAELVKLLSSPAELNDEPKWSKLKFYVDLLKPNFHLPRVHTFYPRNSVPMGSQYNGYDEEFYRETYYTPHEGQSVAPGANGYGAFNPNTGLFQAVAVSTGNQVQVMVGPTCTIETSAPTDAVITAQALIDYQYTVSSSLNPAFVASPFSGLGLVEVEIALLPRVTCIDKSTNAIVSTPSGPYGYKQLRSLTVDFDLQRTPFTTASGHEIRIGRSDQGSDIALPVTFQFDVQLPAKAKCEISSVAYIKSFARGGRGQKRWMFLGFGDVRASGKFLWIEVDLYA